jgi:hypothetical protein
MSKLNFMRLNKSKIAYHVAQWAIGLAFIVCLLNSLFITAYIVHPFRPITFWGDSTAKSSPDYWKGIPLKTRTRKSIYDSSFNLVVKYQNGSIDTVQYNSSYHETLPKPDLDAKGFGKATIIAGDTVTTTFRTKDMHPDVIVKAADISEMTFYILPATIGMRLLVSLPQLLSWLIVTFCAWQLFFLMRDIIKGQVFRRKGYRRLAMIGTAMIMLQVVLFLLSECPPYRGSISVMFNSTASNYHIPVDLFAIPRSSFDLKWLAVGCIVLILAKGFEKGDELQQEQDLMI